MMANALELDQEEAATSNEKRMYQQDHVVKGGMMRDEKRPRFTFFSVVREAIKLESLQKKIMPDLEPLLRRVLKEELDYALNTNFPTTVETLVLPRRIQELQGPCNDSRILQLVFKNKLSQTLFTSSKVEAEDGTPIHVQLLDTKTSQLVSEGPEAAAKLEIVVLDGDFAASEDDSEGKCNNWEQSEFEHYTLKEREGKRPLLTGDLSVSLKEGEASLGEFQFTDNSSWIRSRTFRLGVKVAPGYCKGIRVRKAKTDPFIVKDHRGESYKKHYPPALHDEVWRLDKIGKDGAFHKRLIEANISTVEHFLRFHSMQPEKLRKILGTGMTTKMWEVVVQHAQTCAFGPKQHVYQHQNQLRIIFNNIFLLVGIKESDRCEQRAVDSLNRKEKAAIQKFVKALAHENWKDLIHEYDGDRHLDVNPSLLGNGIAGSNASFIQEENHLVSQSDTTQVAPSAQPLPDQRDCIVDSGSSLNEFSQEPLLLASWSYPAQMQGYITNGIMTSWVPPSLLTAVIPPPACSFALPPEGTSGAITSYVHPDSATQWQPCQDPPTEWSTNCSEGTTSRGLTQEELEVELMHPGTNNNMSSTYLPTYSVTTINHWQDDDNNNNNNNTTAYGFNMTTSPHVLGELIRHANSHVEQQQRFKPAPPWHTTSKPPRAGERQVQQLEDKFTQR